MMGAFVSLLTGLAIALAGGSVGAQGLTFKGYRCTQDCSGHIAGYNWAARNKVKSRSQCVGHSQSFIGYWFSLPAHM